MQRLSQLSSHLSERPSHTTSSLLGQPPTGTPHQPNHNNIPAITNTIMSKPKIVVTRQLIDKAQRLLDEKKDELEILQWNSEKVRLANIP
jgi:7,8-dihydro-6-hydroxymethylpterin-pyrophosphokinase